MVRLRDVAGHAGVSIATASRVLNDRPGVSEANRESVRRAATELGYRPAPRARASAGLIGVIVPELHNPVFPAFAQELSLAFAARGMSVFVGTQAEGGLSEAQLLSEFLDRGVSGIVLVSGQHAAADADPAPYLAIEREVALVLINGHLPGLQATFISHDEHRGMEAAVAHLVELGHRRIGLASGPLRFTPARRKADGFRAALEGAGLQGQEAYSLYSIEGGAAAAGELLERGCTAIVCGSDPMAIGAMRAARARGLRVPADVSIVGHDDSLVMAHIVPGLTTVRQAIAEMAHSAVLALTSGQDSGGGELLFEPELIVRQSTGRAPRNERGTP